MFYHYDNNKQVVDHNSSENKKFFRAFGFSWNSSRISGLLQKLFRKFV